MTPRFGRVSDLGGIEQPFLIGSDGASGRSRHLPTPALPERTTSLSLSKASIRRPSSSSWKWKPRSRHVANLLFLYSDTNRWGHDLARVYRDSKEVSRERAILTVEIEGESIDAKQVKVHALLPADFGDFVLCFRSSREELAESD